MNLASLLKKTALRYPDNIAIVEGEEEISYRQLWQEIESLSRAFSSLGLGQNTNVAILLPNCREFIYSFFALLKINAVAVPLKPGMTCWELDGIFNNCVPEAVICTPDVLNKIVTEMPSLLAGRMIIVKEGKREIPIIDQGGHLSGADLHTMGNLRQGGMGNPEAETRTNTHSRQLASINYTYRGYGYPLGAMLTHANYIHGAFNYIRHRKSSPEEVHLLALPCTHILPLVGCILVPLLVGARVVVLENCSPKKIFHAISANRVDILVLVPVLFAALARHYKGSEHDISSLKYGISGGCYMPAELKRLIKKTMGLDVIQGYGLTECQPVTCNYLDSNKPETLGLPLHGVKIRIVDEQGRDCRAWETGEIVINTPQVMAGYYKNEPDTRRVLKDGWFYSGDSGKVDKDGYVHFGGLKKEILKVNGNTVDIGELRGRVLSMEQIEDASFAAGEDGELGPRIVATVTINDNSGNFKANDLRHFLRRYISSYKIPVEMCVKYKISGRGI